MKVPATEPPPGRADTETAADTMAGAFPLPDERLNHPPPSEVLLVAVQLNAPEPVFKTWKVWEGTDDPPVSTEKVSCPGSLSNDGALVDAMVKVTGIVRFPWVVVVKAICPKYAPSTSETTGLTMTRMVSGVVQQFDPEFTMDNHDPPVLVVAEALKLKSVPVLTMVRICGSGFAPPKDLVNASAGTCLKVCANKGLAAESAAKREKVEEMEMRIRPTFDPPTGIVHSDGVIFVPR
jgi:hypothetical protein